MAAEGDVVPVATEGTDRAVDIAEDYLARVLKDYVRRRPQAARGVGSGNGSAATSPRRCG
jgi:hypothetical protein